MNANSLVGYREAYEDHCADFMDDLFGDVEQSLRLHRERHRPEPEPQEDPLVVSLVKVDVETISLPIVPEIEPQWIDPVPPFNHAPIPVVVPERSSGIDKFFLGTALASMLLGASVVLGHYVMLQRSVVSNPTAAPVVTDNSKPIDTKTAEFSSEIKTAFQTATTPKSTPTNPSPAPVAESPPPAPPQTVVQYVPLYSPPPAEAPVYREPAPVYTAPEPAPRVAAKAPEVEPMPAPSNTGTTLSGLFMLEPNDRSYALIESNGNVQSVAVGGNVGSTGWKLKSVNQETAILEKDGQARSVAVGQKF